MQKIIQDVKGRSNFVRKHKSPNRLYLSAIPLWASRHSLETSVCVRSGRGITIELRHTFTFRVNNYVLCIIHVLSLHCFAPSRTRCSSCVLPPHVSCPAQQLALTQLKVKRTVPRTMDKLSVCQVGPTNLYMDFCVITTHKLLIQTKHKSIKISRIIMTEPFGLF